MDPVELEIEKIPGIGIIRARSLRKAGWTTIGSLRGARTEDLLAVPGITSIKADQILQYVRAAHGDGVEAVSAATVVPAAPVVPAALSVAEPARDAPEDRTRPAPAPSKPAARKKAKEEVIAVRFDPVTQEQPVPVSAMHGPRDLMQEVAMCAQRLLVSEFAGKWDRPLAAQLGKLVSLYEKWDQYEPLGKKRTEKVGELLGKVHRLLTEITSGDLTKRKSQEHFAEVLREQRRRIRDLLKG